MCDLSLEFADMSRQLGVDFPDYFAPEIRSLNDLENDGLLTRDSEKIQITERGRLFIRNIAMRFDAYVPQESERRFSRTI
jgi:oxygen-independent coproporphyrinogen-3 oxidase